MGVAAALANDYNSAERLIQEIIVDNFAGGGGASTGIEIAVGKPVDIAINHDPAAIRMHKVNHPETQHYCESVWTVDPKKAAKGRPVGLAWFSPDCKHFSKAKGRKPVDKNIRGLTWIILKWALEVAPRVIMLENVEEIQGWGPLVADEKGNLYPDPERKGETFAGFVAMMTGGIEDGHPAFLEACEFLKIEPESFAAKRLLKGLGYSGDGRELVAADYGAPTIRKRYFHIFRNDGQPIVWPAPTHGEPRSRKVLSGELKPWRSAAEIIDWSLPCPSIFSRKRPLVEKTMRRIAVGMQKFFIKSAEPFIVQIGQNGFSGDNRSYPLDRPLTTIVTKAEHCLAAPTLIQYHSEQSVREVRGQRLDRPLLTLDTQPRYGLVATFISEYYGQSIGSDIRKPLYTVTTKERHALVASHLVKLKGTNIGQPVTEPIQTITAGGLHFGEVRTFLTKVNSPQDLGYWPEVRNLLNKYCGYTMADDEILLFDIDGVLYFISDVGLRMLVPRELFSGNGFPVNYIIHKDYAGNKYSKAHQVARCGNAVCPQFSEYLTLANVPELCSGGDRAYHGSQQMTLF